MDDFRFVLVGTGNIAATYIQAASKLDGISIVGAVSRSGSKPKGKENDSAFETAPSLEKMKTPFDAVIITTPNGLHHVSAIEAAALGKHVLTEKPLDISINAMDKMIAACEKNNVKLAVTYQRRLRPDNITIKKFLDEKKFGKLVGANLKAWFFRDDAYYDSAPYRGGYEIDGGGPFVQQSSHDVDLYTWFFGLPDKVTSMLGTFLHKIEVEDHGVAVMRHPDGMIGTICASTCAWPGFPPELTVFTEKGTFSMSNDKITSWNIKDIENPAAPVEGGELHSGASSAFVEETSGHESIMKDFAEAVRSNREPAVPANSARLATELILKIYSGNC